MRSKPLLLLLCLLLLTLPFTAFAEGTEPLAIASTEDFLAFAENCRLDSYSQGLSVVMEADIDLTGTDFQGIPIFCGTFDGAGHTVSGLNIRCEGSELGLFRYLTATAAVKNLNVSGALEPQGSKSCIGGIAGSNAGTIQNCTFSGTVSGGDNIGGIAGSNAVTGVIDSCHASGSISGKHFAGGIAGSNAGLIRSCENAADVNTASGQNGIALDDITIGAITGTEAVNTVTDLGGIAGTNTGVIRTCVNRADVGYPHMGYNVGGISGSQMGYITQCENYGSISGRKDVGGIIGQMEPVTSLQYSTDTLQILKQQLSTLGDLTDAASANTQANTQTVNNLIAALKGYVKDAEDALAVLTAAPDFSQLPDLESYIAAVKKLGSSLESIDSTIRALAGAAEDTASDLTADLQAIADQVSIIEGTLETAQDNLGGSVSDISDEDTPDNVIGKIEICINYGSIQSDLNGGGITGAIAPENDLDPEEDVDISGTVSLNFAGKLRAVILSCENKGNVTVKHRNAGGIAGWMSMGLVKDSLSTGSIHAESADYVGGIAGQSDGFIRSCSVKASITGSSYVGGIAGLAETVSDCRSMVLISATERCGSVLGYADNREQIKGNCYLPVGADSGAIDGISYAGCAQPLAAEAFLALAELPDFFGSVTVHFIFEDGTSQTVTLVPGEELLQTDIPPVPEKAGFAGAWEGLHTDIVFDTVFHAAYTPLRTTIQSDAVRDNGLPILLAEGTFAADSSLLITEINPAPVALDGTELLEILEFRIPDSADPVTVRYRLPEGSADRELQLLLDCGDCGYENIDFRTDGSYIVFTADPGQQRILLANKASSLLRWIVPCGCAAAVLLCAVTVLCVRRKRKKKVSDPA